VLRLSALSMRRRWCRSSNQKADKTR